MMTVKMEMNPKTMNKNLQDVINILNTTDDAACVRVCNMYVELCQEIADGIQSDSTDVIMERLKKEKQDNIDRKNRHSISGHANDPSPMQKYAFKKMNQNDEGEW